VPPLQLDSDCYMGCAYTITYIVDEGSALGPYIQTIECCAYPGTGEDLETNYGKKK